MPGEIEGEFEKPLYPVQRENVTGKEYENALQNLENFASCEIKEINTLDDLTLRLHNVGRDLRAVIISTGKLHQLVSGVPPRFVIDKSINGEKIYAAVRDRDIYIDIDTVKHGKEGAEYLVNCGISLPFDEDYTVQDHIAENTYIASVDDWRDGRRTRREHYLPAGKPNNPKEQRGYARLLQEGVTDILSVAKPPTRLPPDLARTHFQEEPTE